MSNYLMHHGVKGMKWGVRRYQPYGEGGYDPNGGMKRMSRRQAKRNFKYSFQSEHQRLVDSDKEYKQVRDRVAAYDKKRMREHPGYEVGDDYIEDWRSLKGKDAKTKALKQYSKDIDAWDELEVRAYKNASDRMMQKYGGRTWKEAYKANKQQIARGRATIDQVALKRWNDAYNKNYANAYNTVADKMNKGGISDYNKKWEKTLESTGGKGDWSKSSRYQEYVDGYNKMFDDRVDAETRRMVGYSIDDKRRRR